MASQWGWVGVLMMYIDLSLKDQIVMYYKFGRGSRSYRMENHIGVINASPYNLRLRCRFSLNDTSVLVLKHYTNVTVIPVLLSTYGRELRWEIVWCTEHFTWRHFTFEMMKEGGGGGGDFIAVVNVSFGIVFSVLRLISQWQVGCMTLNEIALAGKMPSQQIGVMLVQKADRTALGWQL